MYQFFEFESDFVESLRCVPMQVRYKLDTCGVKLKLSQWNQFTQVDRQTLVDLASETQPEIQSYRQTLHQMIFDRTGTSATDLEIDSAPAWLNSIEVPEVVQQKIAGCWANNLSSPVAKPDSASALLLCSS